MCLELKEIKRERMFGGERKSVVDRKVGGKDLIGAESCDFRNVLHVNKYTQRKANDIPNREVLDFSGQF